MPRVSKKLKDSVDELEAWLPSLDRRTEYPQLLMRILASVPGGDEAEDAGYEPVSGMGWKEFDMLGKLIDAIQDKEDVEYAVSRLLG